MKILLLYPYPVDTSGISNQGHDLAKGLKEIGHEVVSCDRENNLQKLYIYKTFKPDAVIGVGFWNDTPEVVISPMNHGLTPVPWYNADGWVANYHAILNSLPLVVANSNWVRNTYIRDGVKGDNIHVCPIGYDPKIFYPVPDDNPDRMKLRRMLGVGDDEIMILTAGGDATSKGAQEMFKAIKQIEKDIPWKYVLKITDSFSSTDHGIEEDKLINDLGLDKNRIIYLEGEYSPEFMAELSRACDIYAAPSRLEGFGMIQLQSLACGRPVISINIGGPADTVVHEKTGFLVEPEKEIKLTSEWAYEWMGFENTHRIYFDEPKTFGYRANVDQLKEYLLKLSNDKELRAKMGKAAAEHAYKNFRNEVVAKKMVDLIEKYALKDKKEIEAEAKTSSD